MANTFRVTVDIGRLAEDLDDARDLLTTGVQQAVALLAAQTHARILESAQSKLRSTRSKYVDALQPLRQVDDNLWVVTLDASARWIEDGMCVLYSPSPKHVPSVLTPDGELSITRVKAGTLVLNRYGKWTRVMEVFERHIVEGSRLTFGRDTVRNPRTRRNNTFAVGTCAVCGFQKRYRKFNSRGMVRKGLYCDRCLGAETVVSIEVCPTGRGGERKLVLTGGHRVYTQRGWVRAQELERADSLMVPSWSRCAVCDRPTKYGRELCGNGCGTSRAQRRLLEKGRHVSQSPDWMSRVYLKTLKNLKRISGAEEAVAGLLAKAGYRVGFYSEGEADLDCVRQYPVPSSHDRLGRQKYYFLDFYLPRLGLAIEVDGKGFHCESGDSARDLDVKGKAGIDTVRIPARRVRCKDFYDRTLLPILANHAGFIRYLPTGIGSLRRFHPKGSFPLCRRWDIRVEDGESFVCQGVLIHNSAHSMVDDLLTQRAGSPARTAADGSRYRVIPFDQGRPQSETPLSRVALGDAVRKELSRYSRRIGRRVGLRKIETGPDGKPLLGMLHQIPAPQGSLVGRGGTPVLEGIRIYQNLVKSRRGRQRVQRSIVSFRVVSSKHKEQGRWVHPGLEGRRFFDEAAEWAKRELDTVIVPQLVRGLKPGR